jgi:hypothetical protein
MFSGFYSHGELLNRGRREGCGEGMRGEFKRLCEKLRTSQKEKRVWGRKEIGRGRADGKS